MKKQRRKVQYETEERTETEERKVNRKERRRRGDRKSKTNKKSQTEDFLSYQVCKANSSGYLSFAFASFYKFFTVLSIKEPVFMQQHPYSIIAKFMFLLCCFVLLIKPIFANGE